MLHRIGRRELMGMLASAGSLWPYASHAQQIRRLGVLLYSSPEGDANFRSLRRALAATFSSAAAFAALASDVVWVSIDGHVFDIQISTGGRGSRSATRDHDALAPPMSATVVRIAVAAGDHVKQGDLLISLEAMKMELPIRAPRDGTIRAVLCREGDLVQPGNVLVEM